MAGPNGAGKTTAVRRGPLMRLVPDLAPLNAGDRTLELLKSRGHQGFQGVPGHELKQAFIEASEQIYDEVTQAVESGQAVVVETVLSTDKYRPLVKQVRAQDGIFNLLNVAVRSPDISLAGITQRVAQGGHDVPADKVVARWHRSLELLPWFAGRASVMWVFDNSDSNPENPPRLIAHGVGGRVRVLEPAAIPEVTSALASLPTL